MDRRRFLGLLAALTAAIPFLPTLSLAEDRPTVVVALDARMGDGWEEIARTEQPIPEDGRIRGPALTYDPEYSGHDQRVRIEPRHAEDHPVFTMMGSVR